MRTAVVVGAGVAGLASAVALHHSGWSVRVFEQQPALRASGTAVVLHRAAIQGLLSLGLGPGLDALTVPLTALQVRTRTSVPLSPTKRGSSSLLIERSALVTLLQRALPDSVITYGEALSARDLPQLCVEADLVVAADGLDSALRRELFGQRYAATATGTTVWRGTARTTTAGLTEYWGQNRRFGASDRPGGGTNWYATAVLPSARTSVQSKPVEVERLFGQWCGPVAGVVESIDSESILRHDIRRLSKRLPRYYRGTVVLTGDAAHAMTPDLGRGANEAILDGLTLSRKLALHPRLERALAAYDRSRRPRTQLIAAGSAAVDSVIHRRGFRAPVG